MTKKQLIEKMKLSARKSDYVKVVHLFVKYPLHERLSKLKKETGASIPEIIRLLCEYALAGLDR